MSSYRLDHLTWPEVGRRLAHDPRLLFAVGALEQHGAHLPLGANTLIAARVVDTVSEALGILRAPPFSYGVTLPGDPFAGTAGLRRKTFHRAINELLERWEDHGVQQFIIVTAHRYDPHVEALLMALTATARTTVVDLSHISVEGLVEGDPLCQHGGELQTSLLLHLAPDLVRPEEIEDFVPDPRTLRRYTRGRVPTPPAAARGTVGIPSRATAQKGADVFRRYVEAVTDLLR